jgi:glycosyltransferase involved in cell wall biosynthesis
MRILVVSNLYPPYHIGGYELGCRDVVEGLKSRGHEIRVLTSTYGVESPQFDGEVYRSLELDWSWHGQTVSWERPYPPKQELHNQRALRQTFKSFKPEILYVWNLMYLSTSLALQAERLGVPVIYFVSDKHWSALATEDPADGYFSHNFPAPSLSVRIGIKILRRSLKLLDLISARPLTFPGVHFVSEFLKGDALQAGKPVAHGEVIPWGVDVSRFEYKPHSSNPRRLLYVGQISPLKKLETAIEVMRILVIEQKRKSITLTVVGAGSEGSYLDNMQTLVHSYGLEENIKFTGPVPREYLPDIYHQHEILIFPSILDEALSFTTLEAMACGLAVVTTATGGNLEVFHHQVNALVFAKEDAEAAAECVLQLLDDADLFQQLSRNGPRIIHEKFGLEAQVNSIERSLQASLARSTR